ncbi:DUF6399 domain-containing protein [Methylobacter svalbardensis]|uniref:DUF6399 domain-containing protein n=1 Tax=Methylobacter svalbardensis TaxID=3080016 RepID=UPI0030EDDBC5
MKRSDGTSAAERLFGSAFPDFFDWLVSQMGELPLPKKARQQILRNPLKLEDVSVYKWIAQPARTMIKAVAGWSSTRFLYVW